MCLKPKINKLKFTFEQTSFFLKFQTKSHPSVYKLIQYASSHNTKTYIISVIFIITTIRK